MTTTTCTEFHFPDLFNRAADADPAKLTMQRWLYLAIRHLLRENFSFDPQNKSPEDPASFPDWFIPKEDQEFAESPDKWLTSDLLLFVSVHGYLIARNYTDPSMGKLGIQDSSDGSGGLNQPQTVPPSADAVGSIIAPQFASELTRAVQYYHANKGLFTVVLAELFKESALYNNKLEIVKTTVRTRQLAEVTQRLIDSGIDANHPQIRRLVLNALAQSLGGGVEASPSLLDIDLPDLDAGSTVDILPDNVRAVGMVYFSAMLEELKLYAVTDKVVEHYMQGMLPVSRGPASDRIYAWLKDPTRFNELERRTMYGRMLGLAQGSVTDILPNNEFTELWTRFLSTVNLLHRERETQTTKRVYAEQVHKSARDLAVNLSLHGYGIAHNAAIEMQSQINEMLTLLASTEILNAYGVRDVWQGVERVAAQYLGGAVNGVRYRTMAQSGAKIIIWLADHAGYLASVSSVNPDLFLDPELVRHVDRWLATTATGAATVERYTEPVDMASQPTYPSFYGASQMQSMVRNALDQVGASGALPNIPNLPNIPQA